MSDSIYKIFTSGVYIEGSEPVNIILTDGSEVDFAKGINVSEGQTINIFGQAKDSGIMDCTGADNDAAIGGSEGQSGGYRWC